MSSKMLAIDNCMHGLPIVQHRRNAQRLSVYVFEEYYESDVKDSQHQRHLYSIQFETGVDVQAKEFDLDFSGQADQVQVPNIDFQSFAV